MALPFRYVFLIRSLESLPINHILTISFLLYSYSFICAQNPLIRLLRFLLISFQFSRYLACRKQTLRFQLRSSPTYLKSKLQSNMHKLFRQDATYTYLLQQQKTMKVVCLISLFKLVSFIF